MKTGKPTFAGETKVKKKVRKQKRPLCLNDCVVSSAADRGGNLIQ
jgi:hypothetical protein